MKKRLLSIIVAITLVIPTLLFVGCSEDANVVTLTGSDATAMTITLYSIVEDEIDEKTRAAVEDAINEVTEFEFNTHIVLNLYTEDEYYDILEKDLKTSKENQEVVIGAQSNIKETEKPPLETNEDGETMYVVVKKEETVYPEVTEGQVDIFLINSVDQYNTHVSNGDCANLDLQLITGTDSAILTKYLNPTLLDCMKRANDIDNKFVYAIPNNHVMSAYEYLLINKDIADAAGFVEEDFKSTFEGLDSFLSTASVSGDYIPVLDTYGVEPLVETVEGYFGYYIGSDLKSDEQKAPKNLLSDTNYQKECALISSYKANGKLQSGEFTDSTKAACVFLKGDTSIKEKYAEDYYVMTYRKPIATNENAYNSMYAINSVADELRVQRCMEIITYMQTNAEFANILRYGVEGKHFTRDEYGIVTVLNKDYNVKPEYAGNMFLHYQNTDMTDAEISLSKNNWALAKTLNLETIIGPYLGYAPKTADISRWTFKDATDIFESKYSQEEIMQQIADLSEDYAKQLEGLSGDALSAKMAELGKTFAKDPIVTVATKNTYDASPTTIYWEWYAANHPEVEE